MAEFRGTDPVIPFLNRVREVKSGWKYRLLLRDTDIAIDDIVESGAFRIHIDTQYERHYRQSHVVPASDRNDISVTGSADPSDNVDPNRPEKHEYTDATKSYPRRATARQFECDFCTQGSHDCPNCETESVVTCPDCHTRRVGDCSTCRGTGQVDCGDCDGSGTCVECSGRGDVHCSACDGTGIIEETETRKNECPNCNGRGSIGDETCNVCGGSGATTEEVTRKVQHRACDGTGRRTCRNCGGSGNCPRCNGSGLVTCPACNGSGICNTCQGDGVEQCPTCNGNRQIICPVCAGDERVFAYTEDRYEYKHTAEEDTVFPDQFGEYRDAVDFDGSSVLTLDSLTAEELRERFGLLNTYIKNQLEGATHAFDELTTKTRNREFDNGIDTRDEQIQDTLFSQIKSLITNDWSKRATDSYSESYKTSLSRSERTQSHEDDYETILFERYHYRFVPMTLLTLQMGDNHKELFTIGTREEYEIEMPTFDLDLRKVATGGIGLVGLVGALSSSPVLASSVPMIGTTGIPWYAVLLAGSLGALLAYAYLVYDTINSEDASIVVVLGPDDALNTTFLSVLAHTVAHEGDGEVKGQIYTKLAENLFEELRLGASLTYAIDFDNGRDIRLVGLSATSYDRMDEATRDLVAGSEGVIGIFCEKSTARSDLDQFDRVTDEYDGSKALITNDEELVTAEERPDLAVYEIPLEDLRDGYLHGETTAEVTVLESVNTIRRIA